MADVTIKSIDQLPEATEPKGTDLLPLWQGEGTKKVPLAAIQASGPDGMRPSGSLAPTGGAVRWTGGRWSTGTQAAWR